MSITLPVTVTHNDFIFVVARRTWDEVFLPVSISIFGVVVVFCFVLFFFLPWIIGECGLWLSLVGIAFCCCPFVTLFVVHRHIAWRIGGPDLVGYRDKTEFCCILRDAVHAFMGVVIARSIDLLDTEGLEMKGKERKWFIIDLWPPDKGDVALFLIAYCLRLAHACKKCAVARVVSV
ncbi:putative solute carrier family 12 member 9-like [Trypanosoma rangeli]|uniref:Putative solute carrier family 12 member 9-like n=1 Tax=Trypanosoma rangeli TaxID=5698 RepID=A0A3R7NB64_TRYRA|nr:putative solute carrier family 12 member 9-like [Trypanosoma rangeli]RNE99863.1 putative solute carrier family 12 member 9-like [Trypanosoma rangeli]|eukprot:RNE99863.1 putative solute carrier family 12 member 9-like [Trypanosoma rangeli]